MTMPLQMTTASTIRHIDKNGALHYYMRDYQGNNMLMLSAEGLVEDSITYYPYGEPILRPTFGGATSGAGSVMAANRYLFADKEYSTLADQKEHNFGARPLPAAIPQWSSPDRFAEKYYPFSTYTYCAANPVKYCDPSGMIIIDKNKIVASFSDFLNSQIDLLSQSGNEGKDVIREYKIILTEIEDLKRSQQVYNVEIEDIGNEGYISFNEENKTVQVKLGSPTDPSLIAHELKHAYQYEKGEISFKRGGWDFGDLYDLTDEVEAYNRQNVVKYGILFYQTPNSIIDGHKVMYDVTDILQLGVDEYKSLPIKSRSIKGKYGRNYIKRLKTIVR